jgi:predicted NodU family carbamoyl transferase
MQSVPAGHDQGILQHLKTQLKYAKGADKKHYEHEIDAFEHLGFHDTYAVGFDKNGRTTVYSLSNKKANNLEDIWNNTTPAYMLGLIKESFGPKVSNKVINILQKGVVMATDSKKATNMAFSDAKIDDAFIAICQHPQLSKYVEGMQANKAFNKWLDQNDIAPKKTGEWLKAAQDYTRQANGEVAYDSFGKIFTKIGELTQILIIIHYQLNRQLIIKIVKKMFWMQFTKMLQVQLQKQIKN